MEKGFLDGPIDLSFWNAHGQEFDVNTKKDYPLDQWEMIQTDLYVQAQGVRQPDQQSFVGDLWYRTNVNLSAHQAAASPHLYFPGLFNSCELYVDGSEVAERKQKDMWWQNDYRFEWDSSLGRPAESRGQCDRPSLSRRDPPGRNISSAVSLCAALA